MRKGALTFLLLCFSTAQLVAQYFNLLYDFNSTADWGLKTVQTSNGYFIFGVASNANGTQAIMGLELDWNGNKILVKEIMKDPTARFELPRGSLKKLANGQFVAPIGNKGNNINGLFSNAGFFMLNAQMDTLLYKVYTDTNTHSEYFWNCDTMTAGDLIFAGSHYPRSQGPSTHKGHLAKTRANGDLIWKKYYDTPDGKGGDFVTVQTQTDGKILVGGFSGYFKYSGLKYYHTSNPWMLLLDTSGNIVYQKFIPSRFAGGGAVRKDLNGGYLHWGVLDSFFTGNSLDEQNLPHYIAHLNDSFDIQWLHNFSRFTGKVHVNELKQLQDSGYLAFGEELDLVHGLRGWASRFNRSGILLWERNYELDSQYSAFITDASQRTDGGFILTGMHRTGGSQLFTQDAWVITIDSLGCPAIGCPWPTSIGDSKAKPVELLEVFPNPTAGYFSLKTSEAGWYFLYGLQGQVLDTRKVDPGITTIGSYHYPPGCYIVKYLSVKGTIKSRRILVIE